jgi:hypothetical protein
VPRWSVRAEGHLALVELRSRGRWCTRYGFISVLLFPASVRQFLGHGQAYFGPLYVSPS